MSLFAWYVFTGIKVIFSGCGYLLLFGNVNVSIYRINETQSDTQAQVGKKYLIRGPEYL